MMGDMGGTVPYMPPEQITNYRDACPPADQYSAAATLYHLVTGRYIFDFGDEANHRRIVRILCDHPVPIRDRRPDVPPALARAIHQALKKDPRARFPDAAAFRAALLEGAARVR
jgi:serine/threonine protein kinase